MDFSKEIIDKFWSYVDKKGEDECWEWKGNKRGGYGRFRINSKLYTASRVSYLIKNGNFPINFACHKCDNPSCVNYNHIWDGNNDENMKDMFAKGRRVYEKGKISNAKLTEEQIKSIRREHIIKFAKIKNNRFRTNKQELAIKYMVSPITITRIISHATWSHI